MAKVRLGSGRTPTLTVLDESTPYTYEELDVAPETIAKWLEAMEAFNITQQEMWAAVNKVRAARKAKIVET